MRINEHVAVSTSKIMLVPYSLCHVPTYHDWMKDPDIQAATASEPLSLDEEYAMQQSWRVDADKLTFILYTPPAETNTVRNHMTEIVAMIGDINMFISIHEEDDGTLSLIGEVELMIATRDLQHKGFGRAALLTFLQYVMQHEGEILNQFPGRDSQGSRTCKFDYLTAKIKRENERSLRLFESTGFERTSTLPNYFDEFELRRSALSLEVTMKLMEEHSIRDYEEIQYTVTA